MSIIKDIDILEKTENYIKFTDASKNHRIFTWHPDFFNNKTRIDEYIRKNINFATKEDLANALNGYNYKTKRGKEWSATSIKDYLADELNIKTPDKRKIGNREIRELRERENPNPIQIAVVLPKKERKGNDISFYYELLADNHKDLAILQDDYNITTLEIEELKKKQVSNLTQQKSLYDTIAETEELLKDLKGPRKSTSSWAEDGYRRPREAIISYIEKHKAFFKFPDEDRTSWITVINMFRLRTGYSLVDLSREMDKGHLDVLEKLETEHPEEKIMDTFYLLTKELLPVAPQRKEDI